MLNKINKESLDVFNRIIRNSPGILFHLEVDLIKKEERYLFISENYTDLFDVEIEYAKSHRLLQTTLAQASREEFLREFYSMILASDRVDTEIEICTPKGNTKWIEIKASIEREDNMLHLFGIYLDITQEKEKKLKQEKITTTLLRLNNHPAVHSGNLDESMQVVTQALAESLNISRVSIWLFGENRISLHCMKLFELERGTFSQGAVLHKNDFESYFNYLQNNIIVMAFDAEHHEGTSCFTDSYLKPLNIKTIIDVPIYHNNKIIGVLCSENTGKIKEFENNEIQFMANVAEIYSYTFSLSEQHAYKKQLEFMNLNLNKLVEERTAELEVKNKEIIDSINYAKRIQRVILPSDKILNDKGVDNFIIYQPKDIVSGDFYWFSIKEDKLIIACADCTGHGVPGSLVSLICYNELSKSINEFGYTDPGIILDRCSTNISKIFNINNEKIRDGMDISLLVADFKNDYFQWAGANNPLWYIQNGNLHVIKGDSQHVGYNETPVPFTSHTVHLTGNETVYLFTDGYADQFGGENGKKYKTAAFKTLIETICHLPLNEQKEKIVQSFAEWKQDLEQVDDVSIIGFRLPALRA